LRQVGIGPKDEELVVGGVSKGSPAFKAGIKEGDVVLSMNGQGFLESDKAVEFIKSQGTTPIDIVIKRGNTTRNFKVAAVKPLKPADVDPMLGVSLFAGPFHDTRIVHPGPLEQVSDSLRMMWTTVVGLLTPSSNIGVDHLSGPVGIGSVMFQFLQMEHGWQRILGFLVLFNVNLAVLNMLPFPVLDGGHITLAVLEKIFGRPVRAKALEVLQTACALLLISLMLFVTSKDIGDKFGRGGDPSKEVVFPE
jgi:regulator of sigma E protease